MGDRIWKNLKKSKALLSSTVGLLATTSIVAPLATMTSCSNVNTQLEFAADKEYGVSEITYKDLRSQLISAYKAKISLGHEGDTDYINKHINYLENQLKTLDQMKDEKKNGFTSLTSAMVEFAKIGKDVDGESYDIRLDRKSNAQWSQLDTIFASWKDSFATFMRNSDITQSTINRVMKDAESKFSNLKHDLMSTCTDALDGVIQGKQLLITCFEDVNDEISLVSATLQLKQMMNQYAFETKTNDDAACLDNITNPDKKDYYASDFKVGNILSPKTMRQLFTITRKEDGNPIDYSPTLIKGYTIQPKLTDITTNEFTNINTFSIDFGLVKTNYIGRYDAARLATVTAHCYTADDWNLTNAKDNESIPSLLHKLAIQSIEFPIYLTKKGEKEALERTYFNKNSNNGFISFQWDNMNAKNQAYESFFDNATRHDTPKTYWTAKLSSNSLTNSCLMICDNSSKNASYKFIKDILDSFKVDKEKIGNSRIQTFDLLFLSSCDISADITIDETDENNKIVTVDNFYANYKNSNYKYENDGKYVLNNNIYIAYQDECVNHQVSDSFYDKVNREFNDVVDFVSLYEPTLLNSKNANGGKITQSKLDELDEDTDRELFFAICALTAGAVVTAIMIIDIWYALNPYASWKDLDAITLFLLIVSLGVYASLFTIWKIKYYDSVQNFLTRYKNFKDESHKSQLVDVLISDLNDHFVLINEDGSYDQIEFANKKKAFSEHNMEWMLKQYRNYSSIQIEGTSDLFDKWNEYQTILKEGEVEPEELQQKISGWNAGGKYWMISSGLTMFTCLSGIGIAFWKESVKKAKAAELKSRPDLTLTEQAKDDSITSAETTQIEANQIQQGNLFDDICESFKTIVKNLAGQEKYKLDPTSLLIDAVKAVLIDYEKDLYVNDVADSSSKGTCMDYIQDQINKRMNIKEASSGNWCFKYVLKMLGMSK